MNNVTRDLCIVKFSRGITNNLAYKAVLEHYCSGNLSSAVSQHLLSYRSTSYLHAYYHESQIYSYQIA